MDIRLIILIFVIAAVTGIFGSFGSNITFGSQGELGFKYTEDYTRMEVHFTATDSSGMMQYPFGTTAYSHEFFGNNTQTFENFCSNVYGSLQYGGFCRVGSGTGTLCSQTTACSYAGPYGIGDEYALRAGCLCVDTSSIGRPINGCILGTSTTYDIKKCNFHEMNIIRNWIIDSSSYYEYNVTGTKEGKVPCIEKGIGQLTTSQSASTDSLVSMIPPNLNGCEGQAIVTVHLYMHHPSKADLPNPEVESYSIVPFKVQKIYSFLPTSCSTNK